jgi:hypothetical protein
MAKTHYLIDLIFWQAINQTINQYILPIALFVNIYWIF